MEKVINDSLLLACLLLESLHLDVYHQTVYATYTKQSSMDLLIVRYSLAFHSTLSFGLIYELYYKRREIIKLIKHCHLLLLLDYIYSLQKYKEFSNCA